MVSEKIIRRIMYGTVALGILISVLSSLFSSAALQQIILITGLLLSSFGVIFGMFS